MLQLGRILLLVVAIAVAAGCATPTSSFQPIAGASSLDGTYRNAPDFHVARADAEPADRGVVDPIEYHGPTLWVMLGPRPRDDVEGADLPSDSVRLAVASDGLITTTLLRDGREVGRRSAKFSYSRGSDRLSRHGFFSSATGAIVVWVLGEYRDEVGLAAGGERGELLVTAWGSGTLWLVAFPVGGAGGGPSSRYIFERAATVGPAAASR